MRRFILRCSSALAVIFAVLTASPLVAQSGFALKAAGVFNFSDVDAERTDIDLEDAAGFNVGAEYVLPGGLGLGISGYTLGSPSDFDTSEGSLVMLAEANYFFKLPLLPISPYAGLHVGLGSYDLDDVQDRVRPDVDFGDRGYQFGVRFQPTTLIGLDAQFRRVSGSLSGEQDASFEASQVLLGVTLF